MGKTTKQLVIGRLGDALGVTGWLHLYSHSDPANNIFTYKNWFILKNNQPVFIHREGHKPHGNHFAVKLKNCDDRDQALLLKNQDIYIDRAELPVLSSSEFYWDDLVGLSVINTHETLIGVVDHLFENGANIVIAVKGEKMQYIPYLMDVVLAINVEKKEIIVDWEIL